MLTRKVPLKIAIAEHPHTSAIRNGSIPRTHHHRGEARSHLWEHVGGADCFRAWLRRCRVLYALLPQRSGAGTEPVPRGGPAIVASVRVATCRSNRIEKIPVNPIFVQGRPIAYRLRLAHLFSKLIADDSVPPERQANALRIHRCIYRADVVAGIDVAVRGGNGQARTVHTFSDEHPQSWRAMTAPQCSQR
ncbi:hypothetical protein SAMN05446935_9313 [Burkholderia sp. YR290]|jgi:hypothetical protein|nr:hypothetical protein SAMN05446934_7195 [Paraburkholderia hospita]SOE90034.1 hypothetical protein SAMN05446935_9313 [Burkholderia sp. YR290]